MLAGMLLTPETGESDYILMKQGQDDRWWFPGDYQGNLLYSGREGVSEFTQAQSGLEVPATQWWTQPYSEVDREGRLCLSYVAAGATRGGEQGFLKGSNEYSQGAAWIPIMLLFRTLCLPFSGADILAKEPGGEALLGRLKELYGEEYAQAEKEGYRELGWGRVYPWPFDIHQEWCQRKAAGATQGEDAP